jgi:hypothetical protein
MIKDLTAERIEALTLLVEKYGITPLFNFAEQVSPVYSDIGKIPFSPSNYLYEPHPAYPKDHVYNQNRRPWSREEREQLQIDVTGEYICQPVGFCLMLQELDGIETIQGITQDRAGSVGHEWSVAKIIGMGETAFDHYKFPFGARATFNDWVFYRKADTLKTDIRSNKILTVVDMAVQYVIPDINKLIGAL